MGTLSDMVFANSILDRFSSWYEVLRRNMGIALILSVVVHLVVLRGADLLLSDENESIVDSLLLVSIEPANSEVGHWVAERNSVTTAHDEPVILEAKQGAAGSLPAKLQNSSPAIKSEAQSASEQEKGVIEFDVASIQMDTVITAPEFLTTVAVAESVVAKDTSKTIRPASAQVPLSPGLEEMLHKKITKWTENLNATAGATEGLKWKYKGQEYAARIAPLAADDEMGMQRVVVDISTENNGKNLSTQLYMKRLAFSSFAQFVNTWSPNLEMHNDEWDGRFHSNSEINLTYSSEAKPLFHGKVTTAAARVNVYRDIFSRFTATRKLPMSGCKHLIRTRVSRFMLMAATRGRQLARSCRSKGPPYRKMPRISSQHQRQSCMSKARSMERCWFTHPGELS
jgi:hypothetical protein